AFGEHFGVHAHANAKVIRHFEKTAWNCGGLELRAQLLQEIISVAIYQLHERSRAPICPDCRKRGLPRKKIPKEFPIRVHDVARFFAKTIQVLERGDSEKLPRVNWRRAIEVIQATH